MTSSVNCALYITTLLMVANGPFLPAKFDNIFTLFSNIQIIFWGNCLKILLSSKIWEGTCPVTVHSPAPAGRVLKLRSCGCLYVVFGCSKFVRIPQVNEHFHAQLELPQGSRPWPCHFDRRGLHCGRHSFSGDICFGQELPSLKLLTRMCTCLITLRELHPTQR